MKKLVSLFVAVAFIGTTAAFSFAQTTTTPAPAAPAEKKADEKKAEKPAAAKKMAAKTVSGTVKSAAADSLVVTAKQKGKDNDVTLAIDPSTKIRKGGKDITAADLQAGDHVTVKYMDHEGKATAQTVTAKAAAAKKAEAKKDETKKEEKK